MSLLYLSEDQVTSLLNWDEVYHAIEMSMEAVSENRVNQPERSFTKVLEASSILLTMPGYLKHNNRKTLGCKLVTSFPNNKPPIETINANIMLFDENNGLLKAVLAGTEITKWRTAAASAVATKCLHHRDSKRQSNVLAIMGAGAQGKIHAICFQHLFKFKEVRIWNRNKAKADVLVEELNNLNIGKFISVGSNKACVDNADVIVTATYASEPIVELDWLKPGVHINAVGAGVSHHSELSEGIYLNSDVFIDHWEGARKELAGLEKLGIEFKSEVGDLLLKKHPLPNIERITVFQSLGMAVEDCAVARTIYEKYLSN